MPSLVMTNIQVELGERKGLAPQAQGLGRVLVVQHCSQPNACSGRSLCSVIHAGAYSVLTVGDSCLLIQQQKLSHHGPWVGILLALRCRE